MTVSNRVCLIGIFLHQLTMIMTSILSINEVPVIKSYHLCNEDKVCDKDNMEVSFLKLEYEESSKEYYVGDGKLQLLDLSRPFTWTINLLDMDLSEQADGNYVGEIADKRTRTYNKEIVLQKIIEAMKENTKGVTAKIVLHRYYYTPRK